MTDLETYLQMIEERLKFEAPEKHKEYIKLDREGKIGFIKDNWDLLDVGYDKNLLRSIGAVLNPLLSNVIKEEVSKVILEDHIPKSGVAFNHIFVFRLILLKYSNNVTPRSLEDETRLSLPYYLMIVESVFTANVNLLVYLLIKDNVRYYRTDKDGKKKFKNISSIDEINRETLHNRLTFLEDNGFSLISGSCDRHLRNSIAHMSFKVFKDGSVEYENKSGTIKISKDDLEAKIERLLNACHCMKLSIKKFYENKYGFK